MKNKILVYVLIAILPLFSFKCKNAKETTETTGNSDSEQVAEIKNLSPNSCAIKAKIIKIEEVIVENPKKICDSLPCKAKVEILEVLGYGSSFGDPLAVSTVIDCQFTFSVMPYKKDVVVLSGLNIGDQFEALLISKTVLGKNEPVYQIGEYKIIK